MIKCKFWTENEHKQKSGTYLKKYINENWSINMSDFSGSIRVHTIKKKTLTLDFEYLEYHDYLKLNH